MSFIFFYHFYISLHVFMLFGALMLNRERIWAGTEQSILVREGFQRSCYGCHHLRGAVWSGWACHCYLVGGLSWGGSAVPFLEDSFLSLLAKLSVQGGCKVMLRPKHTDTKWRLGCQALTYFQFMQGPTEGVSAF
jgi:hypothetical protein